MTLLGTVSYTPENLVITKLLVIISEGIVCSYWNLACFLYNGNMNFAYVMAGGTGGLIMIMSMAFSERRKVLGAVL